MKKNTAKALLKAISAKAAEMTESRTCWYGAEAVETAIAAYLAERLSSDNLQQLENCILHHLPPARKIAASRHVVTCSGCLGDGCRSCGGKGSIVATFTADGCRLE